MLLSVFAHKAFAACVKGQRDTVCVIMRQGHVLMAFTARSVDTSHKIHARREREREKVYSPQYNNTAVKTVSNNAKWRAARKAQSKGTPIVTTQ